MRYVEKRRQWNCARCLTCCRGASALPNACRGSLKLTLPHTTRSRRLRCLLAALRPVFAALRPDFAALRPVLAASCAASDIADPSRCPFFSEADVNAPTGWANAGGNISLMERTNKLPASFTIGMPTGSKMTVTHSNTPTSPKHCGEDP